MKKTRHVGFVCERYAILFTGVVDDASFFSGYRVLQFLVVYTETATTWKQPLINSLETRSLVFQPVSTFAFYGRIVNHRTVGQLRSHIFDCSSTTHTHRCHKKLWQLPKDHPYVCSVKNISFSAWLSATFDFRLPAWNRRNEILRSLFIQFYLFSTFKTWHLPKPKNRPTHLPCRNEYHVMSEGKLEHENSCPKGYLNGPLPKGKVRLYNSMQSTYHCDLFELVLHSLLHIQIMRVLGIRHSWTISRWWWTGSCIMNPQLILPSGTTGIRPIGIEWLQA